MDLHISVNRNQMGAEAAADIAAELRFRLEREDAIRIIFAAAPSQAEMLRALITQRGIDWNRVTAFHMDEYIGLAPGAPQRFSMWLRKTIFDGLPFSSIYLIDPADDPARACRAYAGLLAEAPIDLVRCGIGANGHLAFNDPPTSTILEMVEDPAVKLDQMCRRQQVDDKCFGKIEDVPINAITLTVPALLSAEKIFCCVPGSLKKNAVRAMVNDPISGACPATALPQPPQLHRLPRPRLRRPISNSYGQVFVKGTASAVP